MGGRWIGLSLCGKGVVYALTTAAKQEGSGGRAEKMDAGQQRAEVEELLKGYEGGVLSVRGLQYSASHLELLEFFSDYKVRSPGVYLLSGHDGRATGDAFVAFDGEEAAAAAMSKDKDKLGERWLALAKCSKEELVIRASLEPKLAAQMQPDAASAGVLLMKGLPWAVKEADVVQFFDGYKLKEGSVQLVRGGEGRATGDGYAEFESEEEAEKAQKEKVS
jgi:RNA recognition motif-containing protein